LPLCPPILRAASPVRVFSLLAFAASVSAAEPVSKLPEEVCAAVDAPPDERALASARSALAVLALDGWVEDAPVRPALVGWAVVPVGSVPGREQGWAPDDLVQADSVPDGCWVVLEPVVPPADDLPEALAWLRAERADWADGSQALEPDDLRADGPWLASPPSPEAQPSPSDARLPH